MTYRTKTYKNKYNAKKTELNGTVYDSKFEARVAFDLEMQEKAGEILGFDKQYRVEIPIFNEFGKKVHEVSHKVDFRVHELDGTYTLLEAKGFDTPDYKFRAKLLDKIWLPEHLDHEYVVVYQKRYNYVNKSLRA